VARYVRPTLIIEHLDVRECPSGMVESNERIMQFGQ
jgi:hypothetical protein